MSVPQDKMRYVWTAFMVYEQGNTALELAVEKDDEPLVNYLLQQGANPQLNNHQQQKASDLAVKDSSIYRNLRNYELLAATYYHDAEGIKEAMAAGADINFQGQGGYTAIMIAVEQNRLDMVELLLTYKPNYYRHTEDGKTVYSIAATADDLIYKTLQVKKALTVEEKQEFFRKLDAVGDEQAKDEERFERGRLTLAARKGQPFALSQLKFYDVDSPATEADLKELEQHFGHPLPALYKEICTYYNGGRPSLHYYGEDELDSIQNFYTVGKKEDNKHEVVFNSWAVIENFSSILGPDTLPIGQDPYGEGTFYLKWVNEQAQVWLLLYGDRARELRDDDEDNYEKHRVVKVLINESLDGFLESLYEIED